MRFRWTCGGTTSTKLRKKSESDLRDEALKWLTEHRRELVDHAFVVAFRIVHERGTVTSTEVLAEMREDERWRERVDAADRRFMGPVFRKKKWTRVGWDTTGSHCRPVARWALREDE